MKKFSIFVVLVLMMMNCQLPDQKSIQLKDHWYFQIDRDKAGIESQWYNNDFQFSAKKKVKKLKDWESLTGPNYDGWGWYITEFDYAGQFKKAALHFSSVDDNAIVWINGQKVGDHHGANQAFRLDVTSSLKKGRNRLVVLIEDTGGGGGLNGDSELFSFKTKDDLLKGKYYGAKTPVHPGWAKNAVIYELNTRQFTREGTFKALEPRIKELKDLGVNIVWFMPIHPIGDKRRKGTLGSYYAVKDFYGINPEYGTIEDFKRLVTIFHKAGIHVIIDLVANHTAWDNPLIEQHPEWYTHNDKEEIVSPVADWHDVADLNYENKELWKYMIDMMTYWVADVGIDGYRCDVAAMVPTEFWIEARKTLATIKPVFMLAEAETPELNAFGFDMTYASSMHHLFNAIANGQSVVSEIDSLLKREYYNYPSGSMRMRFTSNHDENTWKKSAITRMGKNGAKVGAVLTCTLPGTPLVYNGQEVGNEKALEFFEKDPIIWKESEFREFYKKLLWTYRNHPALYEGTMRKIKSDNDDYIYAFIRDAQNDKVVTIVNFSDNDFKGNINFNGITGTFTDVFTQKTFRFSNAEKSLELRPWAFYVLVMKD